MRVCDFVGQRQAAAKQAETGPDYRCSDAFDFSDRVIELADLSRLRVNVSNKSDTVSCDRAGNRTLFNSI